MASLTRIEASLHHRILKHGLKKPVQVNRPYNDVLALLNDDDALVKTLIDMKAPNEDEWLDKVSIDRHGNKKYRTEWMVDECDDIGVTCVEKTYAFVPPPTYDPSSNTKNGRKKKKSKKVDHAQKQLHQKRSIRISYWYYDIPGSCDLVDVRAEELVKITVHPGPDDPVNTSIVEYRVVESSISSHCQNGFCVLDYCFLLVGIPLLPLLIPLVICKGRLTVYSHRRTWKEALENQRLTASFEVEDDGPLGPYTALYEESNGGLLLYSRQDSKPDDVHKFLMDLKQKEERASQVEEVNESEKKTTEDGMKKKKKKKQKTASETSAKRPSKKKKATKKKKSGTTKQQTP